MAAHPVKIFSTESELASYASAFAQTIVSPAVVYLSGELGAGKSVFARHVIKSLGFDGAVKSPTFTLVETYTAGCFSIAHLDLYRMESGEELHYIGFEDLAAQKDLLLIEWPERAAEFLPNATHTFLIEYCPEGRRLTRVDSV